MQTLKWLFSWIFRWGGVFLYSAIVVYYIVGEGMGNGPSAVAIILYLPFIVAALAAFESLARAIRILISIRRSYQLTARQEGRTVYVYCDAQIVATAMLDSDEPITENELNEIVQRVKTFRKKAGL